nr:DNA-directed RNA polymerase subunit alpha C-terminal domain-containing protein [Mycobacterium tuberculosis]
MDQLQLIIEGIKSVKDDPQYKEVKKKIDDALTRAIEEENVETSWLYKSVNEDMRISEILSLPKSLNNQPVAAIVFATEEEGMLNQRIVNALYRRGIEDMKELFEITPYELMRIRNLGLNSINKLAKILWDLSEKEEKKLSHQISNEDLGQ